LAPTMKDLDTHWNPLLKEGYIPAKKRIRSVSCRHIKLNLSLAAGLSHAQLLGNPEAGEQQTSDVSTKMLGTTVVQLHTCFVL